jgi:hypothetical protein
MLFYSIQVATWRAASKKFYFFYSILLFGWLVADGWWLVCSERRVLLAGSDWLLVAGLF